jgi:4-alpha-glucanotransferase
MENPTLLFTPFDDESEALRHTAEAWGIAPEYWDIWGGRHETPPEVQRAILESLGVPAGSLDDLNRALEDRLWREWGTPLPPVLVVSGEEAHHTIRLRTPEDAAGALADVRVVLEDGPDRTQVLNLDDLPARASARLRGRTYVERTLRLEPLPLGYHRMRVSLRRGEELVLEAEMELIVAPGRAYLPPELREGGRRAGLYVSLFGLRSAGNWGCGDLGDLGRLCGWVARAGGSFVALNPLHAIHNRAPFNTSPYLPNSVFYRNPIYLDVEAIEDYQASPWAQRLRSRPSIQNEIRALNESEFIHYERVHRLKRAFLRLAFRRFLGEYRRDTPRARQFRRYAEEEGRLLDRYAVYCALDEWLHRRNRHIWNWPDWPARYQDPDSEAVRAFARSRWRSVLFHKYVQWQLDRQIEAVQAGARERGLSIGLFHDLALATDRCGFDLWAHRDFFVAGCRVGAPPDDFSPQGQDWSFPPPDSSRHWQDGYRLFRQSIRESCRHGGALRIDHVMRFSRLFWIPAGRKAADGAYVADRSEDLIRVLALESVRNRIVVVGEDLGTVDSSTRETLARYGILSYRLFYFEKDQQGRFRLPSEYPGQALVSSTTHDLPTLAGFWQGRDIEVRREAGILTDDGAYRRAVEERQREKQRMLDALHGLNLLPPYVSRNAADLPELTGELHNAITGFLASTPSMLFVLNQEDLTKETEQQNLPGTTSQYPNWRRKMRYSLEEMETSREIHDFVAMFRTWLARTGRLSAS